MPAANKLNLTQSTQSSTQGKSYKSQYTKKGEVVSPPATQALVQAVKPKKALSSYLCFTTKNVKRIVEENKDFAYKDGIKKCAEIWNAMDDKARKEYTDLAAQDQSRYENELNQMAKTGFFTNKEGVCSSTIQPKEIKIKGKEAAAAAAKGAKGAKSVILENNPKKAKVPFMFLVKEESKAVMAEHKCPTAAGALKILGERWRNMTDAEKQKYIKMYLKKYMIMNI